jgi:hypothetical protein
MTKMRLGEQMKTVWWIIGRRFLIGSAALIRVLAGLFVYYRCFVSLHKKKCEIKVGKTQGQAVPALAEWKYR